MALAMTEDPVAEEPTKPKRGRPRKKAVVEAETNGSGRAMSDEHKAALAEGREHGRIVRNYLDALHAHKPKRGRKRNPESIQRRLEEIGYSYEEADPLVRLHLAQERMDLQAELEAVDETFDITELEEAFIEVAAAYSERKGLTYDAWREVGVEPRVLKAAGVGR